MNVIDNIKSNITKNSPVILTSLSVAGVLGTAAMAAHDTLNASAVIAKYNEENPDATTKDRLLKVAPCYIPTALVATATIATIIGNHKVNAGRIVSYASAYSLAQEAASRYRDNVLKVVSEEEAKKIDDAYGKEIAEAHISKAPDEVPTVDNADPYTKQDLCYDVLSGRWFHSDVETMRRIQNDINRDILNDMWAPLNTFYYSLGLPAIGIGEELGWSVDSMMELKFMPGITDNGKPYVIVDHEHTPIADTERRY